MMGLGPAYGWEEPEREMPSALPLVQRFQRCRWSATRIAIDALLPGEKVHLPFSEVNNAKTSAQRLRDAYAGQRRYTVRGTETGVVVTREAKPC